MSASFFLLETFGGSERETASVLVFKSEVGEGQRAGIEDWGGGEQRKKGKRKHKERSLQVEGAPASPAWFRLVNPAKAWEAHKLRLPPDLLRA